MEPRPIWYYLAPAVLVLDASLAIADWYLRPAHGAATFLALLLLGAMTLALVSGGSARDDGAPPRSARGIRSGIVFAGLMMACSLGANLAGSLGEVDGKTLSWRALMAILGAFLVFTGNTIPKTLSPMPASPEDAARVQSLQRFAGWTWVLAGLVLSIAWLVLPVRVADPVTSFVVPLAMLLSFTMLVRLRRTRQTPA